MPQGFTLDCADVVWERLGDGERDNLPSVGVRRAPSLGLKLWSGNVSSSSLRVSRSILAREAEDVAKFGRKEARTGRGERVGRHELLQHRRPENI